MRFLPTLLLIWLTLNSYASPPEQLIVVLAEEWHSTKGILYTFEKIDAESPWKLNISDVEVVFGKNGLSWGIGEKDVSSFEGPQKIEGDLTSPTGFFTIGPAFGFAPKNIYPEILMDYIQLDERIEAVDDPTSQFYNEIVNRDEVDVIDWKSSEKMREIPVYEWGFVIRHNSSPPIPSRGSAIFFHLMNPKKTGTAGCTAAANEIVKELIFWIDPKKYPAIVQLREVDYKYLEKEWELPAIPEAK